MDQSNFDGWHEREAARRAATRRVLGEGAIVGFALGLVAQLFVGGSLDGTDEWLVRAALLLPAVVFLVWWLLSPGLRLDATSEPTHQPGSEDLGGIAARARRVEQVFDTAAVPRAHRERPGVEAGAPDRREFRASIRREAGDAPEEGTFGVRRPPTPVRDVDAR